MSQLPVFNNRPAEPEFKDVLELYKRDCMLSTNCHALAAVVSFNPNDTSLTPPRPTITAMLNYPRTVFYPNAGQQTPIAQQIQYSQLVSVPVVFASGGGANSVGGASLTFPIAVGDQVLILFNDRSIDNWKSGSIAAPNGTGGVTPNTTSLSSTRTHHLSDGLALVGFPIFPSSSGSYPTYSQTYALLSNGAAQVGVGNGKVLITKDPAQSSNFNAILQNLITAIQDLQVTLTNMESFIITAPSGGGPCSITGGPASVTSSASTTLTQIATSLGNLFE